MVFGLSIVPAFIGRCARAPCPARPMPAPYGRSPGQGARASCPSGGFAGAHAARTPLFAWLGARPHRDGRDAPALAPAHPACAGSRRSLAHKENVGSPRVPAAFPSSSLRFPIEFPSVSPKEKRPQNPSITPQTAPNHLKVSPSRDPR